MKTRVAGFCAAEPPATFSATFPPGRPKKASAATAAAVAASARPHRRARTMPAKREVREPVRRGSPAALTLDLRPQPLVEVGRQRRRLVGASQQVAELGVAIVVHRSSFTGVVPRPRRAAQRRARAGQARRHRPSGDADQFRRGAVVIAVAVDEQHQDALFRGQGGEGLRDDGPVDHRGRFFAGRQIVVVWRIVGDRRTAGCRAQRLQAHVAGDSVQPRAEGRVAPEAGERRVRRHEDVLQDVVNRLRVLEYLVGEHAEPALVVVDDGGEGRTVAVTRLSDHAGVDLALLVVPRIGLHWETSPPCARRPGRPPVCRTGLSVREPLSRCYIRHNASPLRRGVHASSHSAPGALDADKA